MCVYTAGLAKDATVFATFTVAGVMVDDGRTRKDTFFVVIYVSPKGLVLCDPVPTSAACFAYERNNKKYLLLINVIPVYVYIAPAVYMSTRSSWQPSRFTV